MKSALVIGHQGFVGRNLVPYLRTAGYNVQGTEQFETWQATGWRAVPRLSNHRWDVIVHLGANIMNVHARMNMGMKAFADIALDKLVCEFVEEHPPREAFVVMSSCAVDFPDDPYCIVKRTLEAFAKNLAKQEVPVVILRPFSGYGPDQSLEYPFRAIFARALRKEDPLEVWTSLDTIRDWLHINDLCSAIMHAACGKFPWGVPVEIGTGVGTSFGELAAKIADAVGYQPAIAANTDKVGSSLRRVATLDLAIAHGFTAKITLDEGIRHAAHIFQRPQLVAR